MKAKRELYSTLLKRMKESHDAKYYFEAGWYAYAIVEDRISAALRQTGGDRTAKGKEIKMLGPKLDLLRKRSKTDAVLAATVTDEMMTRIGVWKNTRNDLMHKIATGTISVKEMDASRITSSTDAEPIVRDLCNSVMRLAKQKRRVVN